ncbi:unnamed protein product [Cyclocybe aegerita]|uniref:RFX-type winged-helix domain-containing protein n=1 Tax=Cyclocybe aegerita TaxID=1973307 RepID=A0A8S0XM45_CYCAE|nr:unnamed protein product [Cyclocybe aegerita]
MTTFINNRAVPTPTYYRQQAYNLKSGANVRDDYEILNEQFLFTTVPGVIDGLFEWPEWYVTEGYKQVTDKNILFRPPAEQARRRRFALESLFIIRNAALHETNARDLATHSHTVPLIMNGLHNLDSLRDENCEALMHIIDMLHALSQYYIVKPSRGEKWNPILPLLHIVSQTSNRSLIITTLAALTALLSNPGNAAQITSTFPALTASIRYLPLFQDRPLVDACLNYLYTHVSHPSMARAFLLLPEMPGVLKVLAGLLIHEQHGLEQTFTLDVTGTIHTVSSTSQSTRDHELTKEELDSLLPKSEPQRCYDWMRTMFVAKADGELTQVDFWNLYKDAFSPHAEQYPLLVASDVIKNVNSVFPQAQAMVMQGPVQRFIVRGVDRRKESAANERYRCHWDRSQCTAQPFATPGELYDHVLEHLAATETPELSCLWSTCSASLPTMHALRLHVLTHLSSAQPSQKHPSQSDTITLPSENYPYPTDNPTNRPPPPPRSTTITYEVPMIDPPSTSLLPF